MVEVGCLCVEMGRGGITMLVAEFILGNVSSTHCTLLTNQPSATPTVGKRREPTNQGQVEGQHDYVVNNEYNIEYLMQIADLAPAIKICVK